MYDLVPLTSFPGSCVGGVKSLVHTVCVQVKMVVLSEESGKEAKPVLMVFRHADA